MQSKLAEEDIEAAEQARINCNKSKRYCIKHSEKVRSDKNPIFLKGIWICQPCNNFVHRLTEFPFLAEAWFALKGMIDKEVDIYIQ